MFLHLSSEALLLVPGMNCLQEFLIILSFLQPQEVGPLVSILWKDGYLPSPYCKEGQADFHLRDRQVGWAEEMEGICSVLPRVAGCEVQVGHESWEPHQQQLELRQGWAFRAGELGPKWPVQ